ncbi:MAG: ferrous iron transport protein B [Candidatus Kapaibacteriales bacterium]
MKSNQSIKTIALIGQPNSGKSTIFNVLSDIKVSTANFAGTTVEYKETIINLFGEKVRLIDLPGTYSLNPIEPAEYVTLNFLFEKEIDTIINVIDSTLITRSLELTIELLETGKPLIIALNMTDEAQKRGIEIDQQKLSELLGVPVVKTSALIGKGITQLLEIASDLINNSTEYIHKYPRFTKHIEDKIGLIQKSIQEKLFNSRLASRFWSIKLLENPNILPLEIKNIEIPKLSEFIFEIQNQHNLTLEETIAYERHHLSMSISHKVTTYKKIKIPLIEKLDLVFLRPITGYFFAAFFFVLYFATIFFLGQFLSSLVEAPLGKIPQLYSNLQNLSPFLWTTIEGIYQGFAGAIGIVLPYFLPLLFLTALLEETGYMARIAFLLDGIFHKIGLHGKSVVPFIMGFGCTVPAVFATRIIENRRDRLVTAILINFIPCSARLTVIFALTTALTGVIGAIIILTYVLFAIALTGKILTFYFPQPTGLILDIPPLRMPSIEVALKKTYFKIRQFFSVAFPYLVIGSIVLSWLEFFHFTSFINSVLHPFIVGVLVLDERLGSTLIFGFLRKELAVIMTAQAFGTNDLSTLPLTFTQVLVYLVFIVFYLPCISTTAVFLKEFGWKHFIFTILIGLILSILSALIFKSILSFFF